MAGKLASAMLSAPGGEVLLWTNTTGKVVTANIRFCNQSGVDDKVRVAIGPNGGNAAAAADFITYDTTVKGNGYLEDTGIRIDPGEKLYGRSQNGTCSVRAHGA